MRFFMVKTLQQRLIFFLLLPVACLLLLTGVMGFFYARQVMLKQWREASILKLQRAAHIIDLRLGRPIKWIEMFHKTGGERGEYALQKWILSQLRELEGVTKVRLQLLDQEPGRDMMPRMHPRMDPQPMMRFHRGRIGEVTRPTYDTQAGHETVSLISILKDESGKQVGKLEVAIRFDYLMEDIVKLVWWQSEKACLVDDSGMCLPDSMMKGRGRLGETKDPVELAILKAMKEKPFGTLRGSEHPPDKVAGFYRIQQAPWSIVLFAPGRKILAPIIRFRNYYALGGSLCIVLIILLIRSVAGKMLHSIREISKASESVAQGNYGDPLPQQSSDEIGHQSAALTPWSRALRKGISLATPLGDMWIKKSLGN